MSSELTSEYVLAEFPASNLIIPLPHFEHDHMQHNKQNIKF